MVNLTKMASGLGVFLAFYIVGILLNYLVPLLINTLSTIYTDTNIAGSIYVGLMIIWTVGILIIPNIFIIEGVKEDMGYGTAGEILIGSILFIFGMILTVKGWFFIEGLAAISTNEFITILFWLGTGIIWFEMIMGIPAYLFIRAYQK